MRLAAPRDTFSISHLMQMHFLLHCFRQETHPTGLHSLCIQRNGYEKADIELHKWPQFALHISAGDVIGETM
jgi:hypothetical protein